MRFERFLAFYLYDYAGCLGVFGRWRFWNGKGFFYHSLG